MRRKGRGEITKVADLFAVYKTKLSAPQGTVIKAFQEVVNDLFKITINKNQCSYKPHSKTLSLNIAGPLKTEILIRKTEVLAHLKGRLGEKSAPTEII